VVQWQQIKKNTIKGVELNSKFFFAPINTGLAPLGNPTEELINFHAIRSNEHTGINYVGNIAINSGMATNSSTLFIGASNHHFVKLAVEIEKRMCLPGAQIACYSSAFRNQKKWINLEKNQYKEVVQNEIKKLTISQINSIVKDFQKGIKKLVESGFKVIQIHGAHGYLLNSFLSPTYNKRSDEFGKDRTLIIKNILDGIDSICNNTIIDIRVSLFEEHIESSINDEHKSFLKSIYDIEGIDMISLSNGIYNLNKKLIYPVKKRGHAFFYHIVKDYLAELPDKIWNVCGNIWDLKSLESEKNAVTFSIGRPLIADPDFIKKYHENLIDQIIHCKFKNKCHYYSSNKPAIECAVNRHIY
jgi:2,4-dienoyl-CoA reductase-like NADH-dependent reductase (Old Yellow Enzyme family)